MTDKMTETCEICEGELRLENNGNYSMMVCKSCGHIMLNGIGSSLYLTLTRPEKAALVAALCVTHKHIQPTMNMNVTLEMANETLGYPGIINLLKLTCDSDTIISLLTLVKSKKER